MADATMYVDGTLTGAGNTGVDWYNAYEGATGLQAAFDAVVDGQDTIIYVRNTVSISSLMDGVDTGGGSVANNTKLTIIGCDASGNELTKGNYVDLDAGGNDLGGAVMPIKDVNAVTIKHIHVTNTLTSNYLNVGFLLDHTGSKYGFVFENCKSSGCRIGLKANDGFSRGILAVDCDFEGNSDSAVNISGPSELLYNCIIRGDTTACLILGTYGATTLNCTFIGGTAAVYFPSYGMAFGINNTFYSQSTGAMTANNANSMLVAYNCLIQPDASSDVFFTLTSGSVMAQDYNFLHATADSLLTDNSKVDVTIAFVDAGSEDFTIASILDSAGTFLSSSPGKPDFSGNATRPGAFAAPISRPIARGK